MARGAITRRLILGGLPLGLAAGGLAARDVAAADCVFPDSGETGMQARRNGRAIGERRLAIAREGGDIVARLDHSLRLGTRSRPRYRVEQHVEETWRDGWLHALVSDTEIDGRRWQVRAERRAGVLAGAVNGLRFTVSGYAITSSFWHRDTPTQEALLDVIDGQVRLVRGRLIGEETLLAGDARLATRRFEISGEINGQLWYDGACRLVRLRAPLRDGSDVVYALA